MQNQQELNQKVVHIELETPAAAKNMSLRLDWIQMWCEI